MEKSAINNYARLIGIKGDKLEFMVILRGTECSDSATAHIGPIRNCDS